MISVQEAISILNNNIPETTEVLVSLVQAQNHILAQDVISPINMPPFRQSSMDGFAVNVHDSLQYDIIGEVKAGDTHLVDLKPGQAIKIFTGAAVPDSASAVIQIEKVRTVNLMLFLEELPSVGVNIRPIGEQINKNDIALSKGTIVNAAVIGFLAGLGVTSVMVYKKPAIGVLVTGDELVKPGQYLEHGKIYESNSIMLQAALLDSSFYDVKLYEVKDDLATTRRTINKALKENDVLLISGGISVGDYDFVKSALEYVHVQKLFYKVNQKPGKPLFVGKLNEKLVFALPGNPAASLTCFYVYVLPVLHKISKTTNEINRTSEKELTHQLTINNSRSQFLKASFEDSKVTVLSHQNSSMLNTFAVANCLVFVPEGVYELEKGSKVVTYFI
jgi:molybdopterin molybdotransferase